MFRFTLQTLHYSRSVWLPLVAMLVVPWVVPFISPTDEEFQLYQPALAQGAWQSLWIIGVLFGVMNSANIGKMMEEKKINEHFTTIGFSKAKRFFGQLAPIWIFSIILGLIPFFICVFFASPTGKEDKWMWFLLQAQAYALWVVAIPLWCAPALALATRISSPAATLITLLLHVYGTEAISYADMIRRNLSANQYFRDLAEIAWAISPHIHFADLTNRMVFKMGALDPNAFWTLTLYLAGYSLLIATLCLLIPKSKGAAAMKKASHHRRLHEKKI
jgi:hypothetical protein